jgi:hypothetical protein
MIEKTTLGKFMLSRFALPDEYFQENFIMTRTPIKYVLFVGQNLFKLEDDSFKFVGEQSNIKLNLLMVDCTYILYSLIQKPFGTHSCYQTQTSTSSIQRSCMFTNSSIANGFSTLTFTCSAKHILLSDSWTRSRTIPLNI